MVATVGCQRALHARGGGLSERGDSRHRHQFDALITGDDTQGSCQTRSFTQRERYMSIQNPLAATSQLASTTDFAAGANGSSSEPSNRIRPAGEFVDRRRGGNSNGDSERRQFGSSHEGLTEAGRELALAIDRYKLQHHRRYITCDEMLLVISQLGYSKQIP